MDELKRNGSGCYDPTAYKAMRNYENGGVKMEVYRGDIFYIEDSYRTEGSEQRPGRPALVVSNNTGNYHSNIVSIVWLTTAEKKDLPTHCKILCKTPSTAICEQVVTISQDRLGEYIRTATENEMKAIDRCLLIALGLNPEVTCNESDDSLVDDLKMKLEGYERMLDEEKAKFTREKNVCHALQAENEKLKNIIGNQPSHEFDPAEVVALTTERDIYKQQYEMLLTKLVG